MLLSLAILTLLAVDPQPATPPESTPADAPAESEPPASPDAATVPGDAPTESDPPASTDDASTPTGSAGTAGTPGSSGSAGAAGTAGDAGTTGTLGTIGTVDDLPWKPRPPNGLQQGRIPPWLDLSRPNGPPIRATTLASMVSGRAFRGLKGLDLRGQPIGIEGAKAIAASDALYNVQVLLLASSQLDESSIRALAYARNLSALLVLDLSNNQGSPLATAELAQAAWLPTIEQLDLRHTPAPTPEAARALGERLQAIVLLRVSSDWPTDVQNALKEGLGTRSTALVLED